MFEEDFEKMLRVEINNKFEEERVDECYASLRGEVKEFLGSCGKPLKAKYMTRKLIEMGEKEGRPTKFVPETIRRTIENIKDVEWQGSILRN